MLSFEQEEFKQNKYLSWYINIIQFALDQRRVKAKNTYFEEHHILPSSIFPDFKKETWNLVLLTAKEHFICHRLLVKFTSGQNYYKMLNALGMMSMISPEQKRKLTPHQYKVVREAFSKRSSFMNAGPNNYFYGKKHSEESRKKMSGKRPQFKTENNVNFTGYYITPLGTSSKRNAFEDTINPRALARYCKNNELIISKQSYYASKYLSENFEVNIIGKTFKDIGFSFQFTL